MSYFDARHLPDPTKEYVAWVDVMGIQTAMTRSIKIASNYIFKLHGAALGAKKEGISLYPVMDGVYVSTPSRPDMAQFLRSLLLDLSWVFIGESKHDFRFVVRGAVAYGSVYHGKNVGDNASTILAKNSDYRSQILLGEPMISAHIGERKAPPYGVFVDPSARGEELDAGKEGWWRWFDAAEGFDRPVFAEVMKEFYTWCFEHRSDLSYELDRILVHKGLAEYYLSETPYG